ncbi:MAG: hypothetical protein FH756_00095 [Firmicutes bacterium]|nr:hypothetical protein [Bacillota bacterium]
MARCKIQVNLKVLSEIQRRENLNDMAFAAKIGIDKTMLWRIKTKRNGPGHEFIAKFLSAYPDVKFEEIFFLTQASHGCQELASAESG